MRRTKSASIVIFRQLLLAAVVSLGATIAAATIARAQSVYYGCENKKTGTIRLIPTDGPCKPNETLISWDGASPATSSGSIQTQLVSQTQEVCVCGCGTTTTTPCPLAAGPAASVPVEAQCPAGDVVLGGGFNLAPPTVPPTTPVPTATPTASPLTAVIPISAPVFPVTQSAPNSTGDAWDVSVAVPNVAAEVCAIGSCTNVTAWAICAPGTATGP
jgi:hypothetical protein